MNNRQREFLESLGFHVRPYSCRLDDFSSGLIEIVGVEVSGKIKLEINTWSSSDKSLEMAKKLNRDLTKAIEIVEEFDELAYWD